jgi:hypothetical protein
MARKKKPNLKRDKQGHFKPKMVYFGVHLPLPAYMAATGRAKGQGAKIKDIMAELIAAYGDGRIRVQVEKD